MRNSGLPSARSIRVANRCAGAAAAVACEVTRSSASPMPSGAISSTVAGASSGGRHSQSSRVVVMMSHGRSAASRASRLSRSVEAASMNWTSSKTHTVGKSNIRPSRSLAAPSISSFRASPKRWSSSSLLATPTPATTWISGSIGRRSGASSSTIRSRSSAPTIRWKGAYGVPARTGRRGAIAPRRPSAAAARARAATSRCRSRRAGRPGCRGPRAHRHRRRAARRARAARPTNGNSRGIGAVGGLAPRGPGDDRRLDRLCLSLDHERLQLADLVAGAGAVERVPAHDELARSGLGHQPRRQVHGVAGHGVHATDVVP